MTETPNWLLAAASAQQHAGADHALLSAGASVFAQGAFAIALLVMLVTLAYHFGRRAAVFAAPLLWLLTGLTLLCGLSLLAQVAPLWESGNRVDVWLNLCTAAAAWSVAVAMLVVMPRIFGLPRLSLIKSGLDGKQTSRAQNEAQLHLAIQSASSAMLVVDSQGRIVLSNEEVERIFGYSPSELVGQKVEILVPERFRAGHPHLRSDFFGKPQSRRIGNGRDLYGLRKDRTEVAVELGLTPIEMDEGTFVLGTVIDISERKQLQAAQLQLQHLMTQSAEARAERLSKSNGELEQANLQLKQFASVASHDLQEPLRKMASFCDLLAQKYRGQLDADADRYIRYIVDAANRMRMLINDLLSLSRIGSQPFKPASTDLNAVVAATLERLAMSLRESEAVVTVDELPTIWANGEQISQLLQNLIGNAIKFHRPGVAPVMHISAKPEGSDWVLSLRDNGIGIEPQYRDKIFAIFRRLHAQSDYPGTGIGLAICAKIAERHGGSISVESDPGVGSVFIVRIPQQGAPRYESDPDQILAATH